MAGNQGWYRIPSENIADPKEIIVGSSLKSASFTSIKSAIDSIQDASASNPYLIKISPGVYTESPFSMKEYVYLQGDSQFPAIIQTNNNSANFITLAPNSGLAKFSVIGPTGTSYSCLYADFNSTDKSYIYKLILKKGYYGIRVNSSSYCSINVNDTVDDYIDNSFEQFVLVEKGRLSCSFCGCIAPYGSKNGYKVTGSSSSLYLETCYYINPASVTGNGVDAITIDNGATCTVLNSVFQSGTNAIHIASAGESTLIANGVDIGTDFTKDILCDTDQAHIRFAAGKANSTKLTVPAGTDFGANFSDLGSVDYGMTFIGEIHFKTDGFLFPLGSYNQDTSLTGLVSGGEVQRLSGLTVHIAEGVGYINNPLINTKAEWSATNLTLTANKDNLWIIVDCNCAPEETFTTPDPQQVIVLAHARTDNDSVILLNQESIELDHHVYKTHEYIKDVVGKIIKTGCNLTKSSDALKLDCAAGTYYDSDNLKTVTTSSGLTFTSWYRDGSGDWVTTEGQDTIDDENFDDGSGALVSMSGLSYKQDSLYVVVASGTEFHLVYGQDLVTDPFSIPDAAPPDIIDENGFLLGGIVVQKSAGDIYTINDKRASLGTSIPSVSTGVTDHGLLTGLLDDDHPQYQLESEKGSVSGYCGLDSSAKVAATNLHLTTTPPVDVAKSSASYGSATTIARSDHKHDISTDIPVDIGISNAEGSSTSLARADHVHKHVFGQNYQSAENAGPYTTTSATYQDTISITTGALTGTFLVNFEGTTTTVQNGKTVDIRLYNSTDATTLYESQTRTSAASVKALVHGFALITLTGSSKVIKTQVASNDGAASVSLSAVKMTFWRVA